MKKNEKDFNLPPPKFDIKYVHVENNNVGFTILEKLIDKISACGFNCSLENSAWQPLEIIVNKKNE